VFHKGTVLPGNDVLKGWSPGGHLQGPTPNHSVKKKGSLEADIQRPPLR
jgi:hypothetical protein